MSTPSFFFLHETKPRTRLRQTLAQPPPRLEPGGGSLSFVRSRREAAGGGELGEATGGPRTPEQEEGAEGSGVGTSRKQAARPRHKPLRCPQVQTHEPGCDLIWEETREKNRGHLRGRSPSPRPLQNLLPPREEVLPPSPPRPEPRAALTCWTELFSGTANSSFSFGVFTVTFMILGSVEAAAAAGAPAPSAAAALSWELGGPPLSPFSAMAAAVTQARRRERASEGEPGDARAGRPEKRRMWGTSPQ